MTHQSEGGAPRGAPPQLPLPDAFQELCQNLYYATQVYSEEGDAGRKGIEIALRSVVRFLAVNHVSPELAAPLLAMRGALLDLDKGVSNPIITGEMTQRSRSTLHLHAKMVTAACLEVLVELGGPLDETAAYVARSVGKWLPQQTITATTVRNWRDEQRALPVNERRPFDLLVKDLMQAANSRLEIERILTDPSAIGLPKILEKGG